MLLTMTGRKLEYPNLECFILDVLRLMYVCVSCHFLSAATSIYHVLQIKKCQSVETVSHPPHSTCTSEYTPPCETPLVLIFKVLRGGYLQ